MWRSAVGLTNKCGTGRHNTLWFFFITLVKGKYNIMRLLLKDFICANMYWGMVVSRMKLQ